MVTQRINWHVSYIIIHGKYEVWGIIEKCIDETHDVKILERNPVTNLYPFMLAATGDEETGELNPVYYLLRRNLEVFAHF